MRVFLYIFLLLGIYSSGLCAKPTDAQLTWADWEIGAMISFEMWSFITNTSENTVYHVPPVDTFNPVDLDVDMWIEAALAFKSKYAVLTAKHDAGFCLFPTEYPNYNYSVKHTKWGNGKRDIVKEFIMSCQQYGIKPALYYSVYNNFYLHVTGGQPVANATITQKEYNDVVLFQLNEIWSNYGELVEIWFDGGLIPPSDGGPDVVPLLRKLQPNAVVFNAPPNYEQCIRWIGEEDGTAPDPNWSTCNTTQCEKGGAGSFGSSNWCPAEADTPLRGNGRHDWFWLPDGEKYIKTLPQLYTEYIQSVGRNANYLLNINPNNVGLIDNSDMQRYIEFGAVLDAFDPVYALAHTSGIGSQLTLTFDSPTFVDNIILQEQQQKGQFVSMYTVIGEVAANVWTPLSNGTSIGHKKIDPITPTQVLSLKFVCLSSSATPHIRNFAAYFIGPF